MVHESLVKAVDDALESLKEVLKDAELTDHQEIEVSSALMDVLRSLWSARCDLRESLAKDR